MLTLNIIRNPTSQVPNNIMYYPIDTTNLIGFEDMFKLFIKPIIESSKLHKRDIAKVIKSKLPRVKKYDKDIFVTRAMILSLNSQHYNCM